jgi:hypothetical protein
MKLVINFTLAILLILVCFLTFGFGMVGIFGIYYGAFFIIIGCIISLIFGIKSVNNHKFNILSLFVFFIIISLFAGWKYGRYIDTKVENRLSEIGTILENYYKENELKPLNILELKELNIEENIEIHIENENFIIYYRGAIYYSEYKEVEFRPM